MPQFKVPLRDTKFLLNEVFDYPAHYASLPNGGDATPDVVEAILDECAKFCEDVLFPLNQSGDQEGCHFDNGVVTTPKGFKEAYDQFVAGGWQGLNYPVEFGGQNLPMSMALLKAEMIGTANWSFGMYPGLSIGCMNTILLHGDEAQKNTYMPALVEGRWAGTMCLTEPHCGTDLGQVKTKAEDNGDGTYSVTGTKIFISSGDHDLTENIVHIVLARLPDAPSGTRGISLFIIPKFLPNADGTLGERNTVFAGNIEHKMGIKASATCVMNFDGAKAFLIGPPNKGLECMFTFMNTARIGTAIQGIGSAEISYQNALAYAKERKSMRALTGKKEPNAPADALIHHGDVRRMLLTQKAVAEGGRAMLYMATKMADHMGIAISNGDKEGYDYWDDKLGFLTPILKGVLTELGLEAANHGMQVYGGHGFISEHGMEQYVRDARIATLYEGTTGIQALDLLGRKVLMTTKGKAVRDFTAEIAKFCREHIANKNMRPFIWELSKIVTQWNYMTVRIMLLARKDRDIVGTAANDFLMYSGYAVLAYLWAMQAAVAFDKLENGGMEEPAFYQAKIQTAEFYFDRLLPRAKGHADSMLKPTKSLMQMEAEHFMFG